MDTIQNKQDDKQYNNKEQEAAQSIASNFTSSYMKDPKNVKTLLTGFYNNKAEFENYRSRFFFRAFGSSSKQSVKEILQAMDKIMGVDAVNKIILNVNDPHPEYNNIVHRVLTKTRDQGVINDLQFLTQRLGEKNIMELIKRRGSYDLVEHYSSYPAIMDFINNINTMNDLQGRIKKIENGDVKTVAEILRWDKSDTKALLKNIVEDKIAAKQQAMILSKIVQTVNADYDISEILGYFDELLGVDTVNALITNNNIVSALLSVQNSTEYPFIAKNLEYLSTRLGQDNVNKMYQAKLSF